MSPLEARHLTSNLSYVGLRFSFLYYTICAAIGSKGVDERTATKVLGAVYVWGWRMGIAASEVLGVASA
jgi:hypothetical protein